MPDAILAAYILAAYIKHMKQQNYGLYISVTLSFMGFTQYSDINVKKVGHQAFI